MDVCFIIWVTVPCYHYLLCPNCFSISHEELLQVFCLFVFWSFIYLFMWLLRVLGATRRIFVVARGLLSLWRAGSRARRLSCPSACGILVPQPGIEPTSLAFGGGLLTTGPPGKSQVLLLQIMLLCRIREPLPNPRPQSFFSCFLLEVVVLHITYRCMWSILS